MRIRWNRKLTLISAVLLGGLLVVAAQVATRFLRGSRSPSQLLAVIDGKPITLQAFQGEILRRGGEPNFPTSRERRALLDEMIRTEVLASNAKKAGYMDNPEVRRAIDQLLADRYQRDAIDQPLADLQVGDSDIEDYYRSHIAEFTTPKSIHAAIIFVAVPAGASDEQKKILQRRAEQARVLALAGPSGFAQLATQYSDDEESRGQGGDIGWLSEGQPTPRFEKQLLEAMFDLDNPGQLSPLITTASGIYVVKRLDGHAASLRPLLEVRTAIRQQLTREERLHRASSLYAAALTNVHLSVNEGAVAAMDAAEEAVMDVPHGAPSEPKG